MVKTPTKAKKEVKEMINIRKLEKNDLIKSVAENPKYGIKKGHIYIVSLVGCTMGEYWADIVRLDGDHHSSISTGYDDHDWQKI